MNNFIICASKSLCDRDNYKFTWVISNECDSVIDKFTNYIYNVVHY